LPGASVPDRLLDLFLAVEAKKLLLALDGGQQVDGAAPDADQRRERRARVVDLQVGSGSVTALVSGSMMYDVKVTVGPVSRARWSAICKDCSGAIDSLVELLQGRFSKGVMTRLCEEKTGLFPSPNDILFTCSCPDRASMCKHVAAVLYGIGARLDHQPELLFTLRKVDQQDLIAKAGSHLGQRRKPPAGAKVLASDDLSEMFGIEMAPATSPRAASHEIGRNCPLPLAPILCSGCFSRSG